jgi:hypothetical protein
MKKTKNLITITFIFTFTVVLMSVTFLTPVVGCATEGKENVTPGPSNFENSRTNDLKKFVEKLKEETLEESIENLNDPESFNFFPTTNKLLQQTDTEKILSSRRVTKIRNALARMPKEEASSTCKEIFKKTFSVTKNTISKILASYLNPGASKNETSMIGNKLGLGSAFFLSNSFCTREEILNQIDMVQEYQNNLTLEIFEQLDKFPSTLLNAIRVFGYSQNRTFLNIYMSLLSPASDLEKLELNSTSVMVLNKWEDVRMSGIRYHKEGESFDPEVWTIMTLYDWGKKEEYNNLLQFEKLKKIRNLLK